MSSVTALTGSLGPGDHAMLSYADDDQQRAAVSAFVRDGVARGEKIVYFADRTSPDTLFGYLKGDRPRSGQVVHTALAETLTPFDPARALELLQDTLGEALAEGYAGMRVSAEMTWALRDGPGCEPLCVLEQAVEDRLPGSALTALCQYDLRTCLPEHVAALRRIHACVIQSLLRIRRTSSPPVLRLDGESDLSSLDALATALAEMSRDGHEFVVDVAALEFADVGTLRLLAEREGVVLQSPRPLVVHVLELLGCSP